MVRPPSEFGIKSKVIYSGSIDKILKKPKKVRKNFYNIIAVGRLTPQKDYFTLFLFAYIHLFSYVNFKLKIL